MNTTKRLDGAIMIEEVDKNNNNSSVYFMPKSEQGDPFFEKEIRRRLKDNLRKMRNDKGNIGWEYGPLDNRNELIHKQKNPWFLKWLNIDFFAGYLFAMLVNYFTK